MQDGADPTRPNGELSLSQGLQGPFWLGLLLALPAALVTWIPCAGSDLFTGEGGGTLRPCLAGGALLPGALALVALILMTVRSRRSLLGERSAVLERRLSWLGLTLYRSSEALGEIQAVTLTRERRGGSKSKRTVFPLAVEVNGDRRELEASPQWRRARRNAEAIARRYQVTLRDRSSGTVVERAPDALDRPLVATLGEEDVITEPLPPACPIQVRALAQGAQEIRIGLRPWAVAAFGLTLLPLLAVAIGCAVMAASGAPPSILLPFFGLILLAVGGPALVNAARRGLLVQRLRADESALRLRGPFGCRIPTGAIEELSLVEADFNQSHLHVASDRVARSIGIGLDPPALNHLRAALHAGLTGRTLVIRGADPTDR